MTRPGLTLFAAHLVGNAALLWLGYYWLGVGESDAAHLAFSAAIILFLALAAVWLHGTSLVFFRDNGSLANAAKRSLRNLLPLILLTIVVALIYAALHHFYISFGHEAFNIGSYSTMKLRRPVEPAKVLQGFHIFIWLLRWFVVPVFALPLAAEVADRGWSGFTVNAFRRSRKFLFWLEAGVLLVAAIHLPLHLFYWIPKAPSFALEVVSVTLRIGLGYLLFTAGLLAAEYFTSAGNPRVTQPNTAVSP
jgi:hypothetical protein